MASGSSRAGKSSPQDAVFHEEGGHHLWLEYDLRAGGSEKALRAALRESLLRDESVAPERQPQRVIAFGPVLWSRLAPDAVPQGLHLFEGLDGKGGHHAPPTPHALWFWLHGGHHDENVAAARGIHGALKKVARLAAEEHGFRFRDSRDLTGFVDGTANPKGAERREVALVPRGKRGAGGSHVLVQRWLHDLAAFEQLTEAQQSKVIGRKKSTNDELSGRAMPADAHVARTDIEVDGQAQAIYRRSAPFGGVREHGLMFVAFSRASARFDALLESMFGLKDGVQDRLLEFSRPTSGAYYFAPSSGDLEQALS